MQGAALVVGEVVTLIVRHQVDDRPVGQVCRFIEDEASLLDVRSERAHVLTVRVSSLPGKRSGCATENVHLLEPGGNLVPTSRHWGRHIHQSLSSTDRFPAAATFFERRQPES